MNQYRLRFNSVSLSVDLIVSAALHLSCAHLALIACISSGKETSIRFSIEHHTRNERRQVYRKNAVHLLTRPGVSTSILWSRMSS